jgi:hypothetical protein
MGLAGISTLLATIIALPVLKWCTSPIAEAAAEVTVNGRTLPLSSGTGRSWVTTRYPSLGPN